MKATRLKGPLKKKRSPLVHNMSHKYLCKRRKWSGINAGVFHKIKKPKLKTNKETHKQEYKDKSNVIHKSVAENNEDFQITIVKQKDKTNTDVRMAIKETVPEVDPNKRFFKTNRTLKCNIAATVVVNPKIKLKVTNGKIIRNEQKRNFSNNSQKPKPMDVSLDDAADLTVDEPEVEALIEESKMANILKILEEDWADDESDTTEELVSVDKKNTSSPLKSIMLPNNVQTSPANELSNMTSAINIQDASFTENIENLCPPSTQNINTITSVEKESEAKYYPIFKKGYAMNNIESNITTSTNNTKKALKWQLSAKGGGKENQYQLDAGQKHFGATQCSECGIVYQLGDPEDENAHLNYHNSTKVLKFQGWKNERIITEDSLTSSRIILIEPGDLKQCWKKVLDILNVVDRDLGLTDATLSNYSDKKVYLYIREKTVLGVLVAEHIQTAYCMIPEFIDLDCCTAESSPAKCGINVVWTTMSHRKQGIATKLVDTMRTNFFYGYIVSMDDIAFSTPTPSGKIFAEKYTKTKSFKVYN